MTENGFYAYLRSEPIGLAALVDALQAPELALAGRDDDLAARLPMDPVLGAKAFMSRALNAEPRLEGAGLLCPVWCAAIVAPLSRMTSRARG